MADVDQFGVLLGVAGGQNVRQRIGGIQRGQAGDAQLDAAVVQTDEVLNVLGFGGTGPENATYRFLILVLQYTSLKVF